MKIIDFFKPNLRKIIFFVIIILPFLGLTFPPQFYLINGYISLVRTLYGIPYMIVGCILLNGNCMDLGFPSAEEVRFASTILLLLIIFWSYFVSVVLVYIWDKVFSRFGERAKLYEKIIAFIVIAIIAVSSVLNQSFITITSNTKVTVSSSEIDRDGVLEELIIKNNFPLSASYELPDVTACVYSDIEKKSFMYYAEYKTDKGWVREQTEPPTPNAIMLKPFEEVHVYLTTYLALNDFQGNQVLLLRNVGMDNMNYCAQMTEKDIVSADKIKIIDVEGKPLLNIQPNKEGEEGIRVTLEKETEAKGKITLKGKIRSVSINKNGIKGDVYKLNEPDDKIYFYLDTKNSNDVSNFVIYTDGMNSDDASGLKVEFFGGSETHKANLKDFSSYSFSVLEDNRVSWCGNCHIQNYNSLFGE